MVGMRSADLLRETIWWQVGQPRELGKETAEEGNSLLPFFFRRRGSVGGPTLRGVCRVDRLFIPNSFQLLGHPEVHVVHKLPNGVWKISARRPASSSWTSWTQVRVLACVPWPYKSSINARSDILRTFESYVL